MVPFWVPKYSVPYYIRDPKRDHNFDSHPSILKGSAVLNLFLKDEEDRGP